MQQPTAPPPAPPLSPPLAPPLTQHTMQPPPLAPPLAPPAPQRQVTAVPPPPTPDKSINTAPSWRDEQKRKQEKEASEKRFAGGPIKFSPETWAQKPLYAQRLASSNGLPSGAFLVTIPSLSTTIVIKGSQTVAQDYLGQLLVGDVLGERSVPQSRLLTFTDGPEWQLCKTAVIECFPSASGPLDRPVLTVMEWIDSVCIDALGGGLSYTPPIPLI